MKFAYLTHNIVSLLSQRKSLGMLVGVLSLSNLLLGLVVVGKREQVILIPPHITKPLTLQGPDLSTDYLEEVGIYMAKLLLDLSPATFPYNHQILLKYTTPEAYGVLKQRFIKEGEHYTTLQLSTHFFPSRVTAYPHTLTVEVVGTLTSFVAGRQVHSRQENVGFEFTHTAGGLFLKRISGGLPHDL